jgi:hypothetical protein
VFVVVTILHGGLQRQLRSRQSPSSGGRDAWRTLRMPPRFAVAKNNKSFVTFAAKSAEGGGSS